MIKKVRPQRHSDRPFAVDQPVRSHGAMELFKQRRRQRLVGCKQLMVRTGRCMFLHASAQEMHTIRQSLLTQLFLGGRQSLHMKAQIMEPENVIELVPQILAPKKILVPVDFSAMSKQAFQYALRFAEQFGCEIVLLHVIEPERLIAGAPLAVDVFAQLEDDTTAAEADLAALIPHTVTCPFGLTETAVPVKLGLQIIGYLRIGQVLRHTPAKSDSTKVSRELERCGVRFTGEIRKAWEKTPLIPPDRYNAIARLLTFFAEQLSGLSNQLMMEKNNAEPPLVQKAREYIDKHKTEELSLADVAKAAGASVFHFCKVFHKATGLKFTDYVARVRLEDARSRLINPNLRISEIAYDVGFQSLTQFNRTFKRVFGQSPSDFRAGISSRKRSGKAA